MVPYIIAADGVVTVFIDGKYHSVKKTHPHYEFIKKNVSNSRVSPKSLLRKIEKFDKKAMAHSMMGGVGLTIDKQGQVRRNGKVVSNYLATRIKTLYKKTSSIDSLLKFLQNQLSNPKQASVDMLYKFAENEGLPVTPDGCFLAYKGVKRDSADNLWSIHKGKDGQRVRNNVGDAPSMDRDDVTFDSNTHCSSGFHVGSFDYASDYGDTLIVVKVNPYNVVSVPSDTSEKMRVCAYEVVGIYGESKPLDDSKVTRPTRDASGRFVSGNIAHRKVKRDSKGRFVSKGRK